MPPSHPQTETPAEERLYTRARMVLVVALTLLYFLMGHFAVGSDEWYLYFALLGSLVLGSLIIKAVEVRAGTIRRVVMWTLPLDLFAVAGFTYLFHLREDAFYPLVLMLPVAYALVVSEREAWVAGALIGVAYAMGHQAAHNIVEVGPVYFTLKVLAVPVVGVLVSAAKERQRTRETEMAKALEEKRVLGEELQQRLSELQAVSQVTELIHSSLDFESVGPMVLEIIAKVLGVGACCLFVVDKQRSETIFSAMAGMSGEPLSYQGIGAGVVAGTDEHFACLSIFDHSDVMVLFCAASEDIEDLQEEDRLVLGAVASELVVAVENSRLYKLTRRLAITDELTGLVNYRYLQQRLDEEVERARRYDKQLSLLMLDADDFKSFNDAHGHIAGDSALADLGRVIETAVREVDLVARYGGEEFSVVLPETDAAGAFIVAEKIREAVAEHMFTDADGDPCCTLTVSIGLATFPVHSGDKESLLREADNALYNAKNGGKNRVKAPSATVRAALGHAHEPGESAFDEWTGV